MACGKLLECFDWTGQIAADVATYRPTGHKYDNVLEENTEWMDWTVGGNLDYNGVLYPLCSVGGATTAVAHGASATAKDWVITPPVIGPSIVPQTYTIQQGDAIRAHQAAYLLFTEFSYKGTRKDFTCAGKAISQAISDGISLTNSPTAVAIAPVVAKQVNIYFDSTSGGLGTTLLTRALSVDYTFSNVYGPFYPLNRANASWTAHVDLVPKATMKLRLEADVNGMALLSYLQNNTTYFMRVQAQGAQIASDGPGAVFNIFQHDMAVKVGKPTAFQDDTGIFAIEWELTIVEDTTWGHAQIFTVTSLITAL